MTTKYEGEKLGVTLELVSEVSHGMCQPAQKTYWNHHAVDLTSFGEMAAVLSRHELKCRSSLEMSCGFLCSFELR